MSACVWDMLKLSGLKRKLEGRPRAQGARPDKQASWEVESDGSSTVSNSLDSEFEKIHDRVKKLSREYEYRKRRVKKLKAFGRYKALRAPVVDKKDSVNTVIDKSQNADTASGSKSAPWWRLVMPRKTADVVFQPKPGALEVFCGSGVLAAALEKAGLVSLGIDYEGNKDKPSCKFIKLDLRTAEGRAAFWVLLRDENVKYCHFAPPVGISSLAREIRRKGLKGKQAIDPKPLRTKDFPDGKPDLLGSDKDRVDDANLLYAFVADAIVELTRMGIAWSVENPTNSRMWETSFFQKALQKLQDELRKVHFQMCMHGGDRDKKTTFWYGGAVDLSTLGLMCDKQHEHKPWTFSNETGWATAKERRYPTLLCKRIAKRVAAALLPKSLEPEVAETLPHIYRGSQPRRGMQELIPEYRKVDQVAVSSQEMASEAFKLLDKKVKAAANATLGLSEGDKILGVSEERGIFGPSFVFVGIHRRRYW